MVSKAFLILATATLFIHSGQAYLLNRISDLENRVQRLETRLKNGTLLDKARKVDRLEKFLWGKQRNQYLGCYEEPKKGGRVLNGYEVKQDGSMTHEKCKGLCTSRGFLYAGVEFAKECFCGNILNTEKRPESECNMKCSGNPKQMCGGAMRLSVFLM